MRFYKHAKVTEFANLLHYEFVGRTTTTRDPASLSNRLYPAEAGKNSPIAKFSWRKFVIGRTRVFLPKLGLIKKNMLPGVLLGPSNRR